MMMKSLRIRWAMTIAHVGEMRSAYKILVGKTERKIPIGRPRRR